MQRELILCSHEILAFKRDHAARFAHGRIPVFAPDVSSESATTSLKGHTDSFKSCSEAFQRSDDVTVDSISSVKNRVKVPVPMDADQRTDDSSMSQNLFTRKPLERAQFSGKQIPHRAHLSRSLSNEEEWSSKARKVWYYFCYRLFCFSSMSFLNEILELCSHDIVAHSLVEHSRKRL